MEINAEILSDPTVDQLKALVAVWSVHHQKVEQGLMRCNIKGTNWSIDYLYRVAALYRWIWQVDMPREKRERCFLCRRTLPASEEGLCLCFRRAQVGRWLDEINPATIKSLKHAYGREWKYVPIETIECKECGDHALVEARVAVGYFKRKLSYKTPHFCRWCWKDKRKSNDAAPLKSPVKESTKVDLEDLQEKVAEESPSVAES